LQKAEDEYQAALDAPKGKTDEEEEERKAKISRKKELVEEKKSNLEGLKKELKELAAVQEKYAETLEAKEAKATEVKRALNREKRELAGQIAEALSGLTNKSAKKSEVEKTIELLESVVQTMGMVKTSFEQARLFWKAIVIHCTRLVGMKNNFEIMTKTVTRHMDEVDALGGSAEEEEEKLVKLLKQKKLDAYIEAFLKDGAIISDLDDIEEEAELEEWISKKLDRKRLWQWIAKRKTPEGRAELEAEENQKKEMYKKLMEQRQKEVEEIKAKLKKLKQLLVDHVMQSAWNWVAIGRVSYDAHAYIEKAKDKIDDVMRDGLCGKELDRKVDTLVAKLIPNMEKIKDQANAAIDAASAPGSKKRKH